ncbi:hypothetical protein SAMN05444271_11573 [Halohasta litchfieldiae]|jgi:hypothetical protein|uniref:Uncharacterized protein n=1 Tax=Halohasta litchfieldiae TaxID=1073996 RepID=A0A1H6VHD5_9EURY|nr:hypothetical protein SAMN05444271_11573 [Halohasta litchfieldiae]
MFVVFSKFVYISYYVIIDFRKIIIHIRLFLLTELNSPL